MNTTTAKASNIEQEVLRRYNAGAEQLEQGLCCPANQDYETGYLKVLPAEIIERDYGCGDPSKFVNPGETVLDLGSGAGKICYMIAQKIGPTGKVIGVDFNDEMLGLARKHHPDITERIGYDNVRFLKARIQDLSLDLDRVQSWLSEHPVRDMQSFYAFEAQCETWRKQSPLIASESVDVIVSNCVLNLVNPAEKKKLFDEMFRVLRNGGRAVISDIVCDEDPPAEVIDDPELWSGCIAGAFREDVFLELFEQAGFHGVEILVRQSEPWRVIHGIEFRSMTVRAFKGKQGPCLERHQAVVYKGPWKRVVDDDGHTLHRGQRMAVCDKTFKLYTHPAGPYAGMVIGIEPAAPVAIEQAGPFACAGAVIRPASAAKGAVGPSVSTGPEAACRSPDCC